MRSLKGAITRGLGLSILANPLILQFSSIMLVLERLLL
jgi:hypothetical protein